MKKYIGLLLALCLLLSGCMVVVEVPQTTAEPVSGEGLVRKAAMGRSHQRCDTAFGGQFRHGQCFVPIRSTVIQPGQNMGMNVDHEITPPEHRPDAAAAGIPQHRIGRFLGQYRIPR